MARLDKFGLPIIGAPVVPLAVCLLYPFNDEVIAIYKKGLYETPASEHVEILVTYNDRQRRLTFDEFLGLIFPPETEPAPAAALTLDNEINKA